MNKHSLLGITKNLSKLIVFIEYQRKVPERTFRAIAITRTMINILISHMNTLEPSIGGMGIILNNPNHKLIL